MDKRPSAEQLAKFKANANDTSLSAEVRAKFQAIVDKFSDVEKAVEKDVKEVVEDKPKAKRGRKPKAESSVKKERKPRATRQTADNIEKAKAEIKKRTGKTEAECESIIEEYRALRTKSQERKKKEEQASADNKKRVEKLEKKGDIIEGTTEKTADAVIETAKEDVVEKIEKEIEKVEEKAEVEAKKEVEKEMPKKTAKEKKVAVEQKVEKKVKEKTKVVVKRVVVDTSALLTSIAEALGKFDKDSQKEFLIKLRSDIDKLLSKYAMGGDVSGATQGYNITQSNMSASSVNMYAKGGMTQHGLKLGDKIVAYSDILPFVDVRDKNDNLHVVDLEDGKRYEDGGMIRAEGTYTDGSRYIRYHNTLEDAMDRVAEYSDNELDKESIYYYDKDGNSLFAKGGSTRYNRGLSWHQDRARHNKSEKWEVPMGKRKKYERGGTMFDKMSERRGM